jgi:hypothetical protein
VERLLLDLDEAIRRLTTDRPDAPSPPPPAEPGREDGRDMVFRQGLHDPEVASLDLARSLLPSRGQVDQEPPHSGTGEAEARPELALASLAAEERTPADVLATVFVLSGLYARWSGASNRKGSEAEEPLQLQVPLKEKRITENVR